MRTLGRLLWLSITFFLVMFTILFATSNKTLTTVYLWPFDSALTAPTWLLILSSFVIWRIAECYIDLGAVAGDSGKAMASSRTFQ